MQEGLRSAAWPDGKGGAEDLEGGRSDQGLARQEEEEDGQKSTIASTLFPKNLKLAPE